MSSDFDRAFEIVVGQEGGFVNDPRDPGGKTKFGISDRADGKIDGLIDGKTAVEVLTLEQAKGIYAAHYWLPAHCGDYAWPLSLYVFDCAVNQGVGAASDLLNKSADPYLFMADRALRYMTTKNFGTFGRGWLKRLFAVVGNSL